MQYYDTFEGSDAVMLLKSGRTVQIHTTLLKSKLPSFKKIFTILEGKPLQFDVDDAVAEYVIKGIYAGRVDHNKKLSWIEQYKMAHALDYNYLRMGLRRNCYRVTVKQLMQLYLEIGDIGIIDCVFDHMNYETVCCGTCNTIDSKLHIVCKCDVATYEIIRKQVVNDPGVLLLMDMKYLDMHFGHDDNNGLALWQKWFSDVRLTGVYKKAIRKKVRQFRYIANNPLAVILIEHVWPF
jgi:hypothetical protein